MFESLNHEVFLYSDSKILSMLALIHAFCQHGGNSVLSQLPEQIENNFAPKVQNETQFIFFLRILVPFLQRVNERNLPSTSQNRQIHYDKTYLELIASTYKVLGDLLGKLGSLKYEDTVCDLLYQFKYLFIGYSLKSQIEETIAHFPESMREKLKFLLTHSSSVETTSTFPITGQQQTQHQFNTSIPREVQKQLHPANVAFLANSVRSVNTIQMMSALSDVSSGHLIPTNHFNVSELTNHSNAVTTSHGGLSLFHRDDESLAIQQPIQQTINTLSPSSNFPHATLPQRLATSNSTLYLKNPGSGYILPPPSMSFDQDYDSGQMYGDSIISQPLPARTRIYPQVDQNRFMAVPPNYENNMAIIAQNPYQMQSIGGTMPISSSGLGVVNHSVLPQHQMGMSALSFQHLFRQQQISAIDESYLISEMDDSQN